MSTPERLLELLAHPDADVQQQGAELLRALPAPLRRDTYALATQRQDWQAAAQISSGGDPVRLAWHRRRIWSAAASILRAHHTTHGADLDPQIAEALDALDDTLSGPPAAAARVAVGGLRLRLLARRDALPAATSPWTPPAHVIFYQPALRLSPAEAQQQYRTLQAAMFCRSSHQQLVPWTTSPGQLLSLASNLVLLKLADEAAVLDGLRRQALLQADDAPVTNQRALFARLDEAQRARASVLLRTAADTLREEWTVALRDLGAAAGSALF